MGRIGVLLLAIVACAGCGDDLRRSFEPRDPLQDIGPSLNAVPADGYRSARSSQSGSFSSDATRFSP